MGDVSWIVPLVTFVIGAALSEMRARADRAHRASHEKEVLREKHEHELALARQRAEERRREDDLSLSRETLLGLDEAVAEFTRTVVSIHLERPSGPEPHERWWRVHVMAAREVRRLLARVSDETLIVFVRATLNAGNQIIHAKSDADYIAAMGRTQDNADDVSQRVGELLRDIAAPAWELSESSVPGDGRFEPRRATSRAATYTEFSNSSPTI